MDYARIYREFIADRKERKADLIGYVERHHIQPKALGGGNDAANIIRLTAEDHYFAHCCLAKIYGGKMWSALFAVAHMAKTDRATAYFSKRQMVRVSRVRAAERRSEHMRELWGTGAFVRNRDYRPWTLEERAAHSGRLMGRRASAEAVARQRATQSERASRFDFIRIEDATRFTGTAGEFCAISGVSQPLVSCLTRGKIITAKGWMLAGSNTRAVRGRDPTIRKYVHRDGRIFVGSTYEWRTEFGLDCGSASKMIAGILKTVGGWTLDQATTVQTA